MRRIYGTGILMSMRIAFRNMIRGPITLQYPHEKMELPERSRWLLAHSFHEDGQPKCTACIACERACPDFVIKIDVATDADGAKRIAHYQYEIGACMMCGLCVEACPYDAIYMSHDYELARVDPASLTIDLLTDVPADDPKRRAREKAASAAEPVSPSETAEGGDGAQ
jgi:NADH-quinone oxidoreductase subunit I